MEPNHELPPVREGEPQAAPPNQTGEQLPAVSPEASGNQAPRQTQQSQSQQQPDHPDSITASTGPPVSAGATQQAQHSSTMIADDTDLIEKEWVNKAKNIIRQTKHDPSLQSSEMSKMKVDYVKKRYNKDLKTGGA